jgi:solute carrier family 25 phosphate transporter 3
MVKFLAFERIVELTYKMLPGEKKDYNKLQQIGITTFSGYSAGILCAIVSQPADNVISMLNKDKNATIGGILRDPKINMSSLFLKGLGPRIVMVGTLTSLQWCIYDVFKTIVGFPTSGGK